MFGRAGRLGIVVPANNSVLEPEMWSRLPPDVALYATRIMAKGDLTPEAVVAMEGEVGRAVAELAATGVDVILYADMVTTFIMDEDWNDRRTGEIAAETGVACVSAWTAMRDALAALGVRRFALGTPYPARIHAWARPYFERLGYQITGDATLDISAMAEVPRVTPERLRRLVESLDREAAQAILLLATDLPTFASIDALEQETGLPVLSSNQTLLWRGLRAAGSDAGIEDLGRLFLA